MQSFDYSHFEICLTAQSGNVARAADGGPGTIVIPGELTLEDIDGLRKEAARLADKAVEQYKIKKRALELGLSYSYRNLCDEAAKIEQMAEGDRSEEHKAILKKVADMRHQAKYNYEDRWEGLEDDE